MIKYSRQGSNQQMKLSIDEMISWWTDYFMKWNVDETTISLKWQVDETISLQNDKLMNWEANETAFSWNKYLIKWQVDETPRKRNYQLMKWQVDKTTILWMTSWLNSHQSEIINWWNDKIDDKMNSWLNDQSMKQPACKIKSWWNG